MKARASASTKAQLGLRQGLHTDPRVILSSKVLKLQQQELEEMLQQELLDNPALERLETDEMSFDESELLRKLAYQRQSAQPEDFESFAARAQNPSEGMDWVEQLVAPVSLRDHLLSQLLPLISAEHESVARHVVDCVNERGYLDLPPEEVALLAGAELDLTLQVIGKLQTCEPSGVGAFDLRECLALQLRDLDDASAPLAYEIVTLYWDQLLTRRTKSIARKNRIQQSEVEEAFALISTLTPYPGYALRAPDVPSRFTAARVSPDVVFRRSSSFIHIEIRGSDPAEFMLNRWYRDRYKEMRSEAVKADEAEKKHVEEFVQRALNLMRSLHQRRRTLLKISQSLLKYQEAFISTGGYEFMRRMTRVQLGKATGLHESTVSRATMNKFAQIANGEVVPLEAFFKPALRVQKMIEEILFQEEPGAPLSDRLIGELLKARGIHVARRTVSKYREQIRLLSSHRRKAA